MKWEYIGKQELREGNIPGKSYVYTTSMWRTPVPGGWIMMALNSKSNDPQPHTSFYPDPGHVWKGNTTDGADYLLRPAELGEQTPANLLLRPGPDESPF